MLASDRFIRRFEEYQGAPLTDGEKAELQRLNAVFDIKDDDIAWSAVAALMVSSSMLTRAGQEARRNLEALSSLLEKARVENEKAVLEAKRKIAQIEEAALKKMEERVVKLMQPIEDRSAVVDGLYAERLTAFASRIDDAMEHVYRAGDVVAKASVVGARTVEEGSTAALADLQRVADGFADVVHRANFAIEKANDAIDTTTRRARMFLAGAIFAGVVLLALGIVIGSMFVSVSVTLK
jgi:hypothetical protein